jgi:hypothetical protein
MNLEDVDNTSRMKCLKVERHEWRAVIANEACPYCSLSKGPRRWTPNQTEVHSRILVLKMVLWMHLKRQGFWRIFPFRKSDGNAISARDIGGGPASLILLATIDLVRFAHRRRKNIELANF